MFRCLIVLALLLGYSEAGAQMSGPEGLGYVNEVWLFVARSDASIGVNGAEPLALRGTPDATITGPEAICAGGQGTASVQQVPDATYTWTVSGGSILSGQGTAEIEFDAPGGDVVIDVTVTLAGVSSDGQLTVSVDNTVPAPLSAISGPANICSGEIATYTIDPVLQGVVPEWSVPGDWLIVDGDGTEQVSVLAGAQSGPISVAPVNACGSGVASEMSVAINISPDTAFAGLDLIACEAQITLNAATPTAGVGQPARIFFWTCCLAPKAPMSETCMLMVAACISQGIKPNLATGFTSPMARRRAPVFTR